MSEYTGESTSVRIRNDDMETIHNFKGEMIKQQKRNVTFTEALHTILGHYFALVQWVSTREEAKDVMKNISNIEEA